MTKITCTLHCKYNTHALYIYPFLHFTKHDIPKFVVLPLSSFSSCYIFIFFLFSIISHLHLRISPSSGSSAHTDRYILKLHQLILESYHAVSGTNDTLHAFRLFSLEFFFSRFIGITIIRNFFFFNPSDHLKNQPIYLVSFLFIFLKNEDFKEIVN